MLIPENWRPNTWRGYKRTAYTAHNTREEIFEAGAGTMYPFALAKGIAEGKVELIKELLAKDTNIFMQAGAVLHAVSEWEKSVAVSWETKEPGYLVFLPLKLKDEVNEGDTNGKRCEPILDP